MTSTMNFQGHFELDRDKYHLGDPIWATLIIQNVGDQNGFLFVPRARADGLQITVKQGHGIHVKDLSQESEAGLVPEQKLPPNGTFRQRYQLSEWLLVTEPGDYTVECVIEVEVYSTSLHEDDVNRVATRVHVSNDLRFTILPPGGLREDQSLQRFQDSGDVEDLLTFVQTTGKDPQRYREAADSLAPIFETISRGEQPPYEKLDREALRQRTSEVEDILKWMADSKKDEIKIVAVQTMGFLGWESFVDYVSQYLSSGNKSERLAAIGALGEIPSERAVDALRVVVEDPDPDIRTATAAALFNLSSKL